MATVPTKSWATRARSVCEAMEANGPLPVSVNSMTTVPKVSVCRAT